MKQRRNCFHTSLRFRNSRADYETIADVHNNAGDKTSKSGNILLLGRQGSEERVWRMV